ncbi:hypothetical protein DFH07DRAFT_769199 [Mycena maculata]|uniref:NAD(P)-binding protein n=1 Tax=Mycena maculata TaxID=230809 RepID=A0AAD7NPB9_9AGAR|nr:hypothetical protein DFH07DRAFT_769199 [Mycena maculata]
MGNILHTLALRSHLSSSLIPPSTQFDPQRDIPDLSGKARNLFLGYETAKQLLLKGATVYIATRSPDKASEAIKRLQAETKVTADGVPYVKLDLADLNSVRATATDFIAQFGTNVLGHFFFTELLIHRSLPFVHLTPPVVNGGTYRQYLLVGTQPRAWTDWVCCGHA